VAQANMMYAHQDGDPPWSDDNQPRVDNEYKNAADVLGPRGVVRPSDFSFSDPDVRGPFQWNSDVVAMTEMGDRQNYSDQTVADRGQGMRAAFLNTASSADPQGWGLVQGVTESFPNGDGLGSVFVAKSQFPINGTPGSLMLSEYVGHMDDDSEGKCFRDTASARFECMLTDGNPGSSTGFIPAAVKAKSTLDQPILIVEAHLLDDGSSFGIRRDVGNRINQTAALNAMIPGLLDRQGHIANRLATPNVPGFFVNSPNTRIILMGDLNLESQNYGEHYWVLKKLRDTFGYALDVAMALDDSPGPKVGTGMHNVAAGLDDSGCLQTRYEWVRLVDHGVPRYDLNPHCDGAQNNSLRMAWWASTWRGAVGNHLLHTSYGPARYDFIILLGRGWEMDDPVRAYRILQDADSYENPFAPSKKGVSTWITNGSSNLPGNYKPRFDIGDGLNSGSAAWSSDHHPIGATLRIWAGNGAR
jgi:hypothetical protein